MHFSNLLLGALAATAAAKNSFQINKYGSPLGNKKRSLSENAVVQLDTFAVRSIKDEPAPRDMALMKRQTATLPLKNLVTYYEAVVDIGTPAQTVKLLIDTGSSDIWVIGSGNPDCGSAEDAANPNNDIIDCSISGTFDTSKSSSWSQNTTDFFIQYGDQTSAEGGWGTDTFAFGNTKVSGLSIAVAAKTNSSNGVMGIGLAGLESTITYRGNDQISGNPYENLPMKMKAEGLIKANAYSLWLNNLSSDSGNVLFGGVDYAKIDGDLFTVKLVNPQRSVSSKPIAFYVGLDSVSITDVKGVSGFITKQPVPALLDSGTTLTYLPQAAFNYVVRAMGATYDPQNGYVCPCKNGYSGHLDYNFSGANISVPLYQLTYPIQLQSSSGKVVNAQFRNGDDACLLLMQASEDHVILGDSFLRAAYVVYNLDSYEVSMGQTKYGVSDTNIVEIDSKGVKNANPAPEYSSSFTNVNSETTVLRGAPGSAGNNAATTLSGGLVAGSTSSSDGKGSSAAAGLELSIVGLAVAVVMASFGLM
ncbi:Aspartic proteinase yapsin-3 [Yarrowia sp. C11]|nr:Aspartic proteinase yapsin-3 [Yarrowia sp. E02]KAG5371774.1 Aspartic proteinase yapsin-3 [Yarrowia sp. C11]